MNNEDNNLDLLDLDDADTMDSLPDAVPFAAPRPKKPWLLLGVGIAVIMLATYIIVSVISDDSSSSSIDVDLDVPAVVVDGAGVPVDMNVMPADKPEPVVQPQPVPQPVATQPVTVQPAPQVVQQPESVGVPVRVVEERKEVTFNPTAQQAKPAVKPAAKPAVKKSVAKPVTKPTTANWYVQLASYSTRALAEAGQRQIQNAHKGLFDGQQFVILAAQMKDGTTKYRLRVAFATSKEANGFCRNAKADGLDCYVTK